MASTNKNKTDAEKKVDGDIAKMDLYGILEVESDAQEKAILKAYRKKALKCHPDKNPDNPKAADMFHQLSLALQILTDVPARAAYDKILKAKKASEERHKVLDSKRKKFKEDLEAKERRAQEEREKGPVAPDLTQAERLQAEIMRLRKQGSRMLEEEQERLREAVRVEKQEKIQEKNVKADPPRLKLRWQAAKGDSNNGGYSHQCLYSMLDKYGEISALLLSNKKPGSAIVEFAEPRAALLACDNERGLVQNPLKISWLSGKPEYANYESDFASNVFKAPEANTSVLSGFSYCSNADTTAADNGSPKAQGNVNPNDDLASEGVTFVKSKWDDFHSHNSSAPSGGGGGDDFENLVLRNMRQAQERKRLEEQLRNEDAS